MYKYLSQFTHKISQDIKDIVFRKTFAYIILQFFIGGGKFTSPRHYKDKNNLNTGRIFRIISILLSSIVCVGGDGLCSEIVNGMLRFEDDSHQVKMTETNTPIMLGIIPAGG